MQRPHAFLLMLICGLFLISSSFHTPGVVHGHGKVVKTWTKDQINLRIVLEKETNRKILERYNADHDRWYEVKQTNTGYLLTREGKAAMMEKQQEMEDQKAGGC